MHRIPSCTPQQSLDVVHLSYSAEHIGTFDVQLKPAAVRWQYPPQH
jgi:hypothetical protein